MAGVVIKPASSATTLGGWNIGEAITREIRIPRRLFITVGLSIFAWSRGGRFGMNAQHRKIGRVRKAERRLIQ
jgi:hypothetical protein